MSLGGRVAAVVVVAVVAVVVHVVVGRLVVLVPGDSVGMIGVSWHSECAQAG